MTSAGSPFIAQAAATSPRRTPSWLLSLSDVIDDGLLVWVVHLDCLSREVLTRLASLIPATETDQRLAGAEERLRRRARRGLRRAILAHHCRCAPAEARLVTGRRGRPELAGDPTTAIRFSDSRSEGLYVIAVTTTAASIGVDVERNRPIAEAEAIVEREGTDEERRCWRAVPHELRSTAFLRWWTAKEALLKACGTGLTAPLSSAPVPLDLDGWPAMSVAVGRHPMVVRVITPRAGFVASLAHRPMTSPAHESDHALASC